MLHTLLLELITTQAMELEHINKAYTSTLRSYKMFAVDSNDSNQYN